jgi:PAS domain S-box-containing protein
VKKELRILVLEDVDADVVLMSHELRSGGLAFQAKRVETRDEFLREIERDPPDLILSDHGLPEFDGFAALALARDRCPETPFIFVTGSMGEELAIDSLRSGATDYVLKTRISNLVPVVERALRVADDRMRRHMGEKERRDHDDTAAAALRESEARKTAILETAPDAIISIDQSGRIIEWNPAAERIFGYSRALALGRELTGLIVPKSNEELHRKGLARFLQTGRGRMLGQRTEVMALRANGAEFPVELTITKIPGEGPLVFTSFVRDITERRRTEDALRKSEERFRLLVEGVEDYAIYMLDHHGRITTWNAGAERIMGFRAQEIIGRRFHRFYVAEDVERKKPDQALAVATAEGHFQDERWQVRKDGTQYWASFVITALRDETGRLTGFSTIARDVTKRKNDEDEIRRLNAGLEARVQERTAELRAAYQELEAFSYSISHDLRAPLIHIAGFVEMLKNDLGARLDEKSSRHLQTICDSTENMGRMIADLLTLSRIGRADMHKIRFDLNDTVKEVRRDLQAQAQNRKVTWVVAQLPEVFGDPLLLRQALYNLLGNALKYTRNRAEAHIEITAGTNEHEHIIAIKDNGAGFDMKYAAKLFGVFQRLHSASEFEGTGIGLANVRRIIGRHGGRTWAEGAPDDGAEFYFSLPIVTDDKA